MTSDFSPKRPTWRANLVGKSLRATTVHTCRSILCQRVKLTLKPGKIALPLRVAATAPAAQVRPRSQPAIHVRAYSDGRGSAEAKTAKHASASSASTTRTSRSGLTPSGKPDSRTAQSGSNTRSTSQSGVTCMIPRFVRDNSLLATCWLF
jgi:hypothetical protein